MKPILQSHALYPSHDEKVAHLCRQQTNYGRPIGEVWPQLEPGTEIEVHDLQGWCWDAVILEIDPQGGSFKAGSGKVQIQGERRALPMPPIVDGVIRLPNLSGHAHTRNWKRGSVVRVHGAIYKVRKATLKSDWFFELETSTEEEYAKRPGTVSFSSEFEARQTVGSAILRGTEWLHVKKLVKYAFSGALGRGYTYQGEGAFVTAEKAAKINAVHPVLLDSALRMAKSERVHEVLGDEAVQLIPRDVQRLTPTGTRVKLDGSSVLYEQVGDPDMADVRIPYVLRIQDPELVKRVRAYINKNK